LNCDMVSGATITSTAIRQAVEDCIRQAGGDEAVAALSFVPEKTLSTETESYEADVVVVGAGASGVTAATKANEAGAKVILVERTGIVGGCSLYSFGRTNA